MDLRSIDLNLLVVFDAILRHKSVKGAGVELGLSQPAMSYSLAKMRTLFGDALFFRSGKEMLPTARAQELACPIGDVIGKIRTEVFGSAPFDPRDSRRRFTLCIADIGEANYIPHLVNVLQVKAPHVSLRTVFLPQPGMKEAMLTGEVDLAIGPFSDLEPGEYFQQALLDCGFVCIVRKDNPLARGKLTMARFLGARHVTVNSPARSMVLIEQHMRHLKLNLDVKLRVASFLSLLQIVTKTDLIAVVPSEVARTLTESGDVEAFPLPFETPVFMIRQFWHRRFHTDPGNRWLRGVIYELFREIGDSRSVNRTLPNAG